MITDEHRTERWIPASAGMTVFIPQSAFRIPQFGRGISGKAPVKKKRPSSETLMKVGSFLVCA